MQHPARITESSLDIPDLSRLSVTEILTEMNKQDEKVAKAVASAIPQIDALVNQILVRMRQGGRLFYLGSGTSGRLGVLDASELPPTFGVSPERVVGIIAGGDKALRIAVENAEDNISNAWKELQQHHISINDSIIGISASGNAPYVIAGIQAARKEGVLTGCICCNPFSQLAQSVDFPIEVVVGAEVIAGSTRLKAGTSQKMVLNMISTSLMIKIGYTENNKMVNMQLTNNKLKNRACQLLVDELKIPFAEAESLLLRYGSVKNVLTTFRSI